MMSHLERANLHDSWHAKLAFAVFLCILAGTLVALYSGVPVARFVTQ
jgi:hypothetical protein